MDYDNLCDIMLESLQHVNNLLRLVVHLHGINDDHPGTTEEAWQMFRIQQPNCLLRLSLIHAFDEVAQLHDQILRDNMPLSHLKVLFCEKVSAPPIFADICKNSIEIQRNPLQFCLIQLKSEHIQLNFIEF